MYRPPFDCSILWQRSSGSRAVLIRGPKGCGKTETASQIAESIVRMDIDDSISLNWVLMSSSEWMESMQALHASRTTGSKHSHMCLKYQTIGMQ